METDHTKSSSYQWKTRKSGIKMAEEEDLEPTSLHQHVKTKYRTIWRLAQWLLYKQGN